MKYFKPLFVLNTEFSILKKSNIAKDLFKYLCKEALASWQGCSCTWSFLDPDSFYVNSRINVCTLPESSYHHPSSHKAKFPEPPGGAREEGQVAYDGCRSALKTCRELNRDLDFPPLVCAWMDGCPQTERVGPHRSPASTAQAPWGC